MNTPNTKISEGLALVDTVAASSSSTTKNGAWIPVANFLRFLAVVGVGTLGSSATLDAKIQQATDSSGTGAKDISGKAITQLTAANQQAEINLMAEELDIANNFNYIRLSATVGTAASVSYGLLFATTRYGTAESVSPTLNASTLAQIVA